MPSQVGQDAPENPISHLIYSSEIAFLCLAEIAHHALRLRKRGNDTAAPAAAQGRFALPIDLLSVAFPVPGIGEDGQCQLCRQSEARAFVNQDLENFFAKLFYRTAQSCSEHGFDVALSPWCHALPHIGATSPASLYFFHPTCMAAGVRRHGKS